MEVVESVAVATQLVSRAKFIIPLAVHVGCVFYHRVHILYMCMYIYLYMLGNAFNSAPIYTQHTQWRIHGAEAENQRVLTRVHNI